MHFCPECGQACYCHGDIDDCEVETEEYSSMHCTCDHEGSDMEYSGEWDEAEEEEYA